MDDDIYARRRRMLIAFVALLALIAGLIVGADSGANAAALIV